MYSPVYRRCGFCLFVSEINGDRDFSKCLFEPAVRATVGSEESLRIGKYTEILPFALLRACPERSEGTRSRAKPRNDRPPQPSFSLFSNALKPRRRTYGERKTICVALISIPYGFRRWILGLQRPCLFSPLPLYLGHGLPENAITDSWREG
jgi:hypothetical protein